MATLEAAAVKRAIAIERLTASMDTLSDKLGVSSAVIKRYNASVDPVMVEAILLDTIATWAEAIVKALQGKE